MAEDAFWWSANFQEPTRPMPRPPEPTRLELLAHEADLGEQELRRLLEREVQRRRRQRGDRWKALDETLEERERRTCESTQSPQTSGNGTA